MRNSSERGVGLRLVNKFRRSRVICFGSVKPVHHMTLGVLGVETFIVVAAFCENTMRLLYSSSLFLFQHQNELCEKPTVLLAGW